MKDKTTVDTSCCSVRISPGDSILFLGSCFAANIGQMMEKAGYDVLVNPFGTIFNPASVISSLHRLESGRHFTEDECVQMGAGSGLWCSFSHYTKFARDFKEDFLLCANEALDRSCAFYHKCSKIIITFGTSWYFRHNQTVESDYALAGLFPGKGRIVSNCLKRPSREYSREMFSVDEIVSLFPADFSGGREVIFTVSPIRHLADGSHGNALSKATLLLAADKIVSSNPSFTYFPAYEIVMDELRDYKWYAEDLVHPSPQAVETIWERFKERVRDTSDSL